MKKFKRFTIFAFVLSIFILVSCYDQDDKLLPDTPEEILENPFVKNANKEADFPIHKGNNPPALAGTYLANGQVTDASYLLSEMIGSTIASEFILSRQTSSGKIDFEERVNGLRVTGRGGYITGANGNFTIYMVSEQTGSEAGLPNDVSITVVMLMSGKQSSNGNLTGVEGITIIIEAKSSNKAYDLSAIKGLWEKWEADFYLQAENRSTSALKSSTNADAQLLLQRAMQIVSRHLPTARCELTEWGK